MRIDDFPNRLRGAVHELLVFVRPLDEHRHLAVNHLILLLSVAAGAVPFGTEVLVLVFKFVLSFSFAPKPVYETMLPAEANNSRSSLDAFRRRKQKAAQ